MYHVFYILSALGDKCTPHGGSLLGFPTWYKYLSGIESPNGQSSLNVCLPKIVQITDVWLIVAAIIEIMLRIAGLAAISFIIYGGFQYISSRGEPDKTSAALQTIINALVGLTIAVSATVILTFIAGRFN